MAAITPMPAAQIVETVAANSSPKCSYRSCKVTGAELHKCSASDCTKKVHVICYQGFLLNKHEDLTALPPGKCACTKKCHTKIVKELSGGGNEPGGGNRQGNWDCDQKEGSTKTSVGILIEWWMIEGNYSKYCGKNNNGVKKIQFCDQLAQKMNAETNSQRDGKMF